jgi:hypothetical protein
MLENNDIVGSDSALGEGQVGDSQNLSSDGRVNAGSIRKSTTNNILNALSSASGQQFDSVEAAIGYIARTASQKTNVGNEQPVEPRQVGSKRNVRSNESNDLREQFAKLQSDLHAKERMLRQKELDTEILRTMGDKFDNDFADYAMQKVKSNIKFGRDGSYSIVNSKGQERYGMDGNPLTIQGLVDEVAQGNPKLLKGANGSSGSGLRPGNGNFAGAPNETIPDYSRDPAAFNAWAQKRGLGKGVGLKGAKVSATVSGTSKTIL